MIAALLWALSPAGAADTVTLSGALTHTGSGAVRVELLQPGEPDEPARLLWTGEIERPGAFSLRVPAGLGVVRLRAGADPAGDGLGPRDPYAVLPEPLQIGDRDLRGLEITLIRPDVEGLQ